MLDERKMLVEAEGDRGIAKILARLSSR